MKISGANQNEISIGTKTCAALASNSFSKSLYAVALHFSCL